MKEQLLSNAGQAKTVCLWSIAALAILFVWQTLLIWDKPIGVRASVFAVQILPFLLVLRGLMIGRWRSYAWMLFFLNLYFVVVALRLVEHPDIVGDWLMLLILTVVFASALLFVRWTRVAESYGA